MPKPTDDYEKLTIAEALKELNTNADKGLTAQEASSRIASYGYNEIPEKEQSAFVRIVKRFWGPIPWMIEVAAILSAAVRRWEDFAIIMVLLFTNVFIDFWQEAKALSALKVLKEKLAKKALALRDGVFQTIDARELVPGDIIKIKIGDVVPADLKLIEGGYVQADQSALTGESLPVAKKPGDIAYSNSVIKQGEMKALVVNTALNTFFGKTVALVAKAGREERSHFQKAVIGIGNYLIFITIFLAVLILITAMFRQENILSILRFTLVLTVAAIPVALPAVLSVTMAVGAMNLAKKQAIVSRLVAIEELAGVDILCSDKTGTLTQNRMTVADPIAFGPYSPNDVMIYAALASRRENMDPIELPVFEYLEAKGLADSLNKFTHIRFVPFDPVSKRTETQVLSGDKTLIITKGAPQVILGLCGEAGIEGIGDKVGELAEKGFRTLGVAVKSPDDKHFRYAGLIPLFDPPREDSSETIREARELGLDVKMVTGDNRAIARQIGSVLGIGDKILEASELKGASTRELVVLGEIIAKTLYRKLSPAVPEADIQRFSKEVIKDLEK